MAREGEAVAMRALSCWQKPSQRSSAPEVHTREHLPQPWAVTQRYLGEALAAQGIQAGDEAGKPWLEQAVAVYQRALEVRTTKCRAYGRKPTITLKRMLLLRLAQRRSKLCQCTASVSQCGRSLSHCDLISIMRFCFEFPEAFALNQHWLERHPDDLSALSDFAEKQLLPPGTLPNVRNASVHWWRIPPWKPVPKLRCVPLRSPISWP